MIPQLALALNSVLAFLAFDVLLVRGFSLLQFQSVQRKFEISTFTAFIFSYPPGTGAIVSGVFAVLVGVKLRKNQETMLKVAYLESLILLTLFLFFFSQLFFRDFARMSGGWPFNWI